MSDRQKEMKIVIYKNSKECVYEVCINYNPGSLYIE
jgi:hypothetical protein